jgi:predicted RNase H-like HicB family nuclease
MEKQMKPPQYSYFISWSPEDKEFVASFVEIPELSGLGLTIVDAVKELREALIGWLETAKEKGFNLPEPVQESGAAPLVIIDRSYVGKDPVLTELPLILPEDLRPEKKPVETAPCATAGARPSKEATEGRI